MIFIGLAAALLPSQHASIPQPQNCCCIHHYLLNTAVLTVGITIVILEVPQKPNYCRS
jgi:hypothetical protein